MSLREKRHTMEMLRAFLIVDTASVAACGVTEAV